MRRATNAISSPPKIFNYANFYLNKGHKCLYGLWTNFMGLIKSGARIACGWGEVVVVVEEGPKPFENRQKPTKPVKSIEQNYGQH